MKTIVIGMLVGMGPNSTGPFYDRVMQYARESYGAKYDADFPRIVMISQPTPFYLDRPIDNKAMLASLKDGLSDLKTLKVDFVVIPCNTVHQYADDIEKAIAPTPFLNMVHLAVEKLSKSDAPVALLATSSTIKSGIYQRHLLDEGFQILDSEELQEKVTSLIAELKIKGLSPLAVEIWKQVIANIKSHGCKQVVLACTDLNPCLKLGHEGLTIIDAGDVLAKATIEEYVKRTNMLKKKKHHDDL